MSEELSYEDIINLPAPVSHRHRQMPMAARAAQFAPFAALSGYGEAIQEAARVTEEWLPLCASEKARIDRSLRKIQAELPEPVEVSLTRFLPDARKDGGVYEKLAARVVRVEEFNRRLVLDSGETVPFRNILRIVREKNTK